MQAFAILVYLPVLNAVLFGFLHIIHISINSAAAACRLSTAAHMFVFLSFFLFTTLALIFFQNLFEDNDEEERDNAIKLFVLGDWNTLLLKPIKLMALLGTGLRDFYRLLILPHQ